MADSRSCMEDMRLDRSRGGRRTVYRALACSADTAGIVEAQMSKLGAGLAWMGRNCLPRERDASDGEEGALGMKRREERE